VRISVNAQAYEDESLTGIGRYTEYLYQHIWTIDSTNSYVFFSNRPSKKLQEYGGNKVIFRKAPSPLVNKYIRVSWENFVLPILLFKHRIDLLHCVNYSLPFVIPPQVKKIVTVHDLIWLKFPHYFPKDTVYAAKKRLQHACIFSDAIITASENTKKDVIEASGCEEQKVVVIYNGVDYEAFSKVQKKSPLAHEVRQKYKLPEHFILWVGSYREHKNLELLCKAVQKAKTHSHLPHKLVFCGPGLLRERDIREISRIYNDDVVIIGPASAEELSFLYAMADVFVFPSLYEGFGLPVLEAMAAGTPVITSNISSPPEVAGDAAILVNPLDVEEIADAIIKVTTDDNLKQTLVKKGRERAKQFSWEDTARKTLEVFMKVGFNDTNWH